MHNNAQSRNGLCLALANGGGRAGKPRAAPLDLKRGGPMHKPHMMPVRMHA